jgi:hypothetical protein
MGPGVLSGLPRASRSERYADTGNTGPEPALVDGDHALALDLPPMGKMSYRNIGVDFIVLRCQLFLSWTDRSFRPVWRTYFPGYLLGDNLHWTFFRRFLMRPGDFENRFEINIPRVLPVPQVVAVLPRGVVVPPGTDELIGH